MARIDTLEASDKQVECGTERWEGFIQEAAQRFEISPVWVRVIIRVESAGCDVMNGRAVTSAAGAMGLMQLMPNTWLDMRQRFRLGTDPYDPRANILAGSAYLRELYNAYGRAGVFTAYHAGPKRYEESLTTGRALPDATLEYARRIHTALSESDRGASSGLTRPAMLDAAFVERQGDRHVPDVGILNTQPRSLFVTLKHDTSTSATDSQESTDVQSN